MLDPVEESLNLIALAIVLRINLALLSTVASRGNDHLDTCCCKCIEYRLSVIGSITEDRSGNALRLCVRRDADVANCLMQKIDCNGAIVIVARREHEDNKAS